MKKSSLIAILLCVILVVSMLAGCGSKEPEIDNLQSFETVAPGTPSDEEEEEPTPVVITNAPEQDSKKPTPEPEYNPITPAPDSVKSGLGIGDTFKGAQFKVTPIEVKKLDSVDKGTPVEYKPKSGNTLVAIRLKVENISGKEAIFTATSSIEASVKGKSTEDFSYLTIEIKPIDEAKIPAGGFDEGYVLFEVPSDGGSLKLTYNANLLDGDESGIFEIKY